MKKACILILILLSILFAACPMPDAPGSGTPTFTITPSPDPNATPTPVPKALKVAIDHSAAPASTTGNLYLDLNAAGPTGLGLPNQSFLGKTFQFDLMKPASTVTYMRVMFSNGGDPNYSENASEGFGGHLSDGTWQTVAVAFSGDGSTFSITYTGGGPTTVWAWTGANFASIGAIGMQFVKSSDPGTLHYFYVDNIKLFETANPANISFEVGFELPAGTSGWYSNSNDAIRNAGDDITVVDRP